jgi:G3E family GTPase
LSAGGSGTWEHRGVTDAAIPLTVIGGYLGSGKTTVLNALLREPAGRRLGVIVNDFGTLAVDAALLGRSSGEDDGVVSLPNGCVCCTLGTDLQTALAALTDRPRPPEHVVVEVSGVADPANAAAWGTVPPYEPGGVIVLADATAVRRTASDRYVGGEVLRQLAGADLVVVTKVDLTTPEELGAATSWLDVNAAGVPRLAAVHGDLPADAVLGLRPGHVPAAEPSTAPHEDRYERWAWSSAGAVGREALRDFVDQLGAGVLRAKGVVLLEDAAVVVDVVGRRRNVSQWTGPRPPRSQVVAIGLRGAFDAGRLDAAAASLSAG